MLIDFAIVLGGAAGILVLAEIVIRQTLRLAHHYGMSGSFVGLTILSVGTSLLEIVTHVVGSIRILREPRVMDAMSSLLLGSNVGSDIFQQNFVLAIVGMFSAVAIARRNLAIEVGGLLAASALLWVASLDASLSRLDGGLLTAAYAAYLVYLARHGVHDGVRPRHQRLTPARVLRSIAFVIACFAGMALIADPVLSAATRLVVQLPISASFFGIVVLGVCAALPELATALVSVRRGEKEISAGILIGSNITNPLFGAGLGALISTYAVPSVVFWYDLPIKIGTALLLLAFLLRHERLRRLEAAVLLCAYLAYVALRPLLFPADL